MERSSGMKYCGKSLIRVIPFMLLSVITLLGINTCFAQSMDFSDRIDMMLMKENFKQVISTLDSVLRVNPENSEAHYKIALAFQNLYQYDRAVNHLEKAGLLSAEDPKIYSALGRSYFNLGDNEKAIKAYKTAVKNDSANFNNSFNLARVMVDEQLYGQAIEIYRKLLMNDSSNSYIYKQLGYCTLKCDAIPMSTYYYVKAYLLNPNDLNVALQLGINYIKLNRLNIADSIVNKYIKLYPDDARFFRLKGEIFFRIKDYMGADSCYSKVIDHGDSSAYVFQKLGFSNYLYATTNDSLNANQKVKFFEKASWAFSNSAEQDSTNPVTHEYLGLSYNKSGKFNEGLAALYKAKKFSISDVAKDICVYIGMSLRDLKQFKEAIEAYKEALHFRPDDANIFITIATLYAIDLKDKKSAGPYYLKFYQTKLKETPELDKGTRKYLESEIRRLKGELSLKDEHELNRE